MTANLLAITLIDTGMCSCLHIYQRQITVDEVDYVMKWNNERGPRIAFLRTGAQGVSIAADFALAGPDVTFIDQWPDHIEALRKNGITINLLTRTINDKKDMIISGDYNPAATRGLGEKDYFVLVQEADSASRL